MAEQAALQILTATFTDAAQAGKALSTLASALDRGQLGMSAVVAKTDDGKVRFVETHDQTAAQGALKGGTLGALAGLAGILFTPVAILGMPIGAGIGALVGKLRDTGFKDEDLRGLGADLEAGSSALLATVHADVVDKARRLLAELSPARVVVSEMDARLAEILDRDAATPA